MPAEMKRWRLGAVGYALFAANALWKGRSSVEEVIQNVPVAELLPGGQFPERWHQWLTKQHLTPRVFARISLFTDLARVVQTGHAAAVLPVVAAVDFDPKKFEQGPIPALRARMMVLIANDRSLERSGIRPGVAASLAEVLKLG